MIAILQIVIGFVLLIAGGELLVRGASQLAIALRISPLVIGLTIVAFGTSSPELAVSVQSAFAGNADLALGNVVGSNIFNVLMILGASALIAPLVVSSQLIRRDVPLMIGASFLLLAFGLDGRIGRLDGAILFGGILAYTYWCIRQSRRESRAVKEEFDSHFEEQQFGSGKLFLQIGLIIAGLILLGVGSNLLVKGAVSIATWLGVSQLIIGLTIVAAGTSLPELITSVMAALRGERDIAVGNIVGSNLFNILCVMGCSGLIAPDGITVTAAAIQFDIPVMIVVAVACLPIFFTGNLISRWEGALFLSYYLLYTAYLVLDATGNSFGHTLRNATVLFLLPLTLITLAIALWRSMLEKRILPADDNTATDDNSMNHDG